MQCSKSLSLNHLAGGGKHWRRPDYLQQTRNLWVLTSREKML
jgi:hypothetical protein